VVHKVLKSIKKRGSYSPKYSGTFLWLTVYIYEIYNALHSRRWLESEANN